MAAGNQLDAGAVGATAAADMASPDRTDLFRRLVARLPRPMRFLGVGAVGLLTDLSVFTAIPQHLDHPLVVRLVSLAVATLVTWRLNRALTFDRSGRRQHAEAVRYAVVTAVAQGTSYAVFAALVLTVLGFLPQAATVIGAAIAALVSYNGHRLYAFAPIAAPRSGVSKP
ncbi:MAG: GtrA family protein [Rhodoplanes sp.]|uniref:GtrA family protein n=1 Tax=Rhodoplanes sp. TaxID=1968906 RepID=UPI0017DF58AD|nr:GtrA family protein [Rhodoplanes sp.]NVO14540.1 GtrA family protein [Rhodoplanes sp.]